MDWKLGIGLRFVAFLSVSYTAGSRCNRGCDLALASYYVWQESNLSFIAQVMQSSLFQSTDFDTILSYNPQVANKDKVLTDTRILIPYPCDCIDGEFLAHVFHYSVIPSDTYDVVANVYYSNLTTVPWLQQFNSYNPNRIPDPAVLNVTVNCSCGDSAVNKDYGLFLTYPLRPGETLDSVASANGVSSSLLTSFNVKVNFSQGNGLVYVPSRDANGSFRPLKSSTGLVGGAIAGITIAAVAVVLLLAVCIYLEYYRKRKVKGAVLQPSASQGHSTQQSTGAAQSTGLSGITVDKSVEFSYEELAKATNDFNMANKIGKGGFGSVYYAELRGEKTAIKKMDMQASKEFFAELKVLTHVHHLNLVRLIGYCVESSLFLVYEYIENGNLSQHLRGSGRDPLPWSTRVQIALDTARGLEYIHEHTIPVYVHRDIKSANILIDKNFHGKVADFGLTKLTGVGSGSLPTRLVGTFGYMPPEYAQYGDVSPKVDVYAFGVVLYELISAKEAIGKGKDSAAKSRSLVALFEEALNQPDSREDLRKLVDPRLGDNCPLESVLKMAELAEACTHVSPQLRPRMRSIVVALMTLSSTTGEWDVGSFHENPALVGLMSGR